MSSKNFYGLTGDVTVDGGILNVGNAQLYANTETSNVGIGTTNAEFKLDVRGDANVHNLYATYLHGDGSNIENIVSSQWEGSPGDPIYYASNVGIANTSPVTTTMQIGSNVVIDDVGSNVMHVTGNVYATRFIGDGAFLENIASSFQAITDNGNVTTNTVEFDGSTSLVTTGSVGIANTAPVHNLDIGSNLYVEDAGSNVLYVTGNIYADYLVGDGSQLTGIAASLDQIVDQGNTVSNTIQIVSGQDATSNIGLVTHDDVGISVSNTNPTGAFQFGVGSNLLVNVYSSNVLTVDGNVLAQKMTLGTVTVTPAYNLQQITTKGATTSQTLILENATTGLTTTSNVGIANTAPVHTLDVGSNLYVEDTGSNVLTVTGNVSVSGDLNVGSNLYVTERLDVGSNLHIENLRVAEVASNLVTYDSTTGEIMDSGGLFSNKLAVVSEQPPIALTGASTVVTNHGTYTIEASSGTVVNLFDKVPGESNKWVTDGNYITNGGTKGTYGGSASLAGHGGEWVKITMPYKTILRHIKIESTNESVEDIELVGLNADGLTWTPLKTETGLTGTTHTIIVNATTHHRTYGLIVVKTNTTTGRSAVEIGDLKLFTESFSIDGGKVEMASSAVMGGETTMDQHGPHGRGEAKLKKYPEIIFEDGKFDRNDTTNTYTQAGYTVSASSQLELSPYRAWNTFDGNIGNEGWHSYAAPDSFTGTVGGANSYNGTSSLGGVSGAWLKLELPHKIRLSSIDLLPRVYPDTQEPKDFKILGSNDDTNWVELIDVVGATWTQGTSRSFSVTGEVQAYKYLAISVSRVVGSTVVILSDLKYYGYEELATQGDTSVDTTFTSIMNTPQTTGANVYVDGSLGGSFTNRVTGPDATGPSATYDATGKYWEMNGSLESNIAVEANTFLSGDQPHAVSVWFNSSNLEANVSNTCVFSVSDQEKLDSVNLDLQSNTWHNLTYAYQGEGGSRVTYLDGRKVAEDQAEDTFGEYPPFAMTGYAQGGYVVSASSDIYSHSGFTAWKAFNNVQGSEGWHSGYNYLTTDTSQVQNGFIADPGGAITTTASATNLSNGTNRPEGGAVLNSSAGNIPGEWLKVELPHKIKLSYAKIVNRTLSNDDQCPKDFKILGSNDDDIWYELIVKQNAGYTAGSTHDEPITNTQNGQNAYKYLAFLCTRINSTSGSSLTISEISYYGHRENDLVRLPDPTNVLEYPHIAVGVPQDAPAKRGYVVTTGTSIFSGRTGARAFDDQPTGDGWETDNGSFSDQVNQTGGDTFTNLGSGGGSFTGHWIQLEMPHKLKFTGHIEINAYVSGTTDDRRPDAGAFLGSNDGSNWYLLHEFTSGSLNWVSLGGSTNQAKITTLSASNTNAYKYVVMVITKKSDVGTSTITKTSIRRLRYYGTGVDSVPIQIGGGNIDKVANFRVYDKFVGEDQALEIWDAQKDAFGRAKSSMTLHKGRLGIGTTEPEGRLAVADEPHAPEVFPPGNMVADETYFEGHGKFKARGIVINNNVNYPPWGGFNDIAEPHTLYYTGNSGGATGDGGFNNSDATYSGTLQLSSETVLGPWLILELPYKVYVSKIEYYPQLSGTSTSVVHQVAEATIYGRNGNGIWKEIATMSTAPIVPNHLHHTFNTLDSSIAYDQFAFIATKRAVKSTAGITVRNLKFFGTREQGQSVLHDGELTLTKSLNVPRIGPALDADDTPRRDRLVVEYNTSTNPTFEGAVRDTSGRGNDGAFYDGASYDATEKALDFDGTNDYVRRETLHNFKGGNITYGVSMWINLKRFGDANGSSVGYIYTIGNVSSPGQKTFVYVRQRNTGENPAYQLLLAGYSYDFPINKNNWQLNRWYHIVVGYGGTTFKGVNLHAYVDGVNVGTLTDNASNGGDAGAQLNIAENPRLTLAKNDTEHFSGYISNFKLYDTVLTAEEVKTLYDMGRCDEGHHVVNFSKTRVGIGLGDGEAPRAALDVRGDIRYISIAPIALPTFYDHILAGRSDRGIYPIVGTQGGTKIYNVYCEPDMFGGGWMCFAQVPRVGDISSSVAWSLYTDELGDSSVFIAPQNSTTRRHAMFSVPMNILSNNNGVNLDVLLMIYGDALRNNGTFGAKVGAIWRGVNLNNAFNSTFIGSNGPESNQARSSNGVDFTASSLDLEKANDQWDFSISVNGEGVDGGYGDTNDGTAGYIVHQSGTGWNVYCDAIVGPGGSWQYIGNTSWEYVRFFVRPSSF